MRYSEIIEEEILNEGKLLTGIMIALVLFKAAGMINRTESDPITRKVAAKITKLSDEELEKLKYKFNFKIDKKEAIKTLKKLGF